MEDDIMARNTTETFTYCPAIVSTHTLKSICVDGPVFQAYLCIEYYTLSLEENRQYKISWSTPHCVLTLKLIGLTWDLYDGAQQVSLLSLPPTLSHPHPLPFSSSFSPSYLLSLPPSPLLLLLSLPPNFPPPSHPPPLPPPPSTSPLHPTLPPPLHPTLSPSSPLFPSHLLYLFLYSIPPSPSLPPSPPLIMQ